MKQELTKREADCKDLWDDLFDSTLNSFSWMDQENKSEDVWESSAKLLSSLQSKFENSFTSKPLKSREIKYCLYKQVIMMEENVGK